MSSRTVADTEPLWRALADPTRRALLDALRAGPRSTGVLAAEFPTTRFAVMKHLGVLVDAGLVTVERRGRERLNHLNPVPLRQAYEGWVRPFGDDAATLALRLAGAAEEGTTMTNPTTTLPTPAARPASDAPAPGWPRPDGVAPIATSEDGRRASGPAADVPGADRPVVEGPSSGPPAADVLGAGRPVAGGASSGPPAADVLGAGGAGARSPYGLDVRAVHHAAVPVERTWAALLALATWWPPCWPDGERLAFEPRLAGRLGTVPAAAAGIDDAPSGELWGVVTGLRPGVELVVEGTMGIAGPVAGRWRLALAAVDGGTAITVAHRVLGPVDAETRAGFTTRWPGTLAALASHAEAGT